MAIWVVYRDQCQPAHFAVALKGDAVFRAVEHVGSLYAEFVESFEKRSNANAEKLLAYIADANRNADEQHEMETRTGAYAPDALGDLNPR